MSEKKTKGIILAGGSGTRLYPITEVACKQLLPVYDKPMIYYPLSTIMECGIRDILIISTPKDLPQFEQLFKSGSDLGLNIEYKVQNKPAGIAQAFLIGKEFIGDDNVMLILGDNIFYGSIEYRKHVQNFGGGALVFGYKVNDPERYGVVEFKENGNVVSIEEKPVKAKSNYAVTGLYLYDSKVVSIAESLQPSNRGELEITDVNNAYLKFNDLNVVKLGRGIAWLDTGTQESMLEAGEFIATIEKRQGQKIACIEEIAFKMNFIDKSKLQKIIHDMNDNSYKQYLENVLLDADELF
ncbi:MAG: glucose-1-phosphate thymidylyltransferase [Candidatus Zixiibacteriota bacterium]|nr:MAG: glucose-1-phosphate thymidylyltransferase [candidate division Zixibacteria bacterium]